MKKTSAVFHVLLLRSKNSSSYHYCSKAIFLMTGLVVMNSCHSIHLKFGLRLILQAALFGLRLIEFANRINGWWYVKLSPGSSLSWRTFFVKSFLMQFFFEIDFTKKKKSALFSLKVSLNLQTESIVADDMSNCLQDDLVEQIAEERQIAKGFFRGARLSLFHNGGIVQLFVMATLFV